MESIHRAQHARPDPAPTRRDRPPCQSIARASAISRSPIARSALGTPPVTAIGVAWPSFIRYSVAFFYGAMLTVCAASSGDARTLADQEPRVLQRAEPPGDHEIAAALERRRMRLLENHVADAEQRGHHRDAEPEAAGQHRRTNRPRRQRAEREPQNHATDHSSALHRQMTVGARRHRRIVRDDDDRRAVGVDAIEQRGDLFAGFLVELAGRLVGEQQRRPVGQRARDRHPLHLAARQLRRPMVAAPRQADVLEQLACARPPVGFGRAGFRLRQLDVLPRGEHRQQEEALKHEADARQPDVAALGLGQRRRRRALRTRASRRSADRHSRGCGAASTCRSRTGR